MSGGGVQKVSNLVVALKKVEKLQKELIEVEQVIKVALLDNLSEDVGSVLDSLIHCFIPNLVTEIDKLLGIGINFQTPKICGDIGQREAYHLAGDVSFIKEFKEEPCDDIFDDADDGDEHFQDFQIIPDKDQIKSRRKSRKQQFQAKIIPEDEEQVKISQETWPPTIIVKEESVNDVGEEIFEDFQIFPDNYQVHESQSNLEPSPPKVAKMGRPRKTEKSECKPSKSHPIPILPKPLPVFLKPLTEQELNKYSSPSKVINLLPLPLSQKFRLIAPKIIPDQSEVQIIQVIQNSSVQSKVREEVQILKTFEPKPKPKASKPSSSSENENNCPKEIYIEYESPKIKPPRKKPGRKPNPNKVIPQKPTEEEIKAHNDKVKSIDVASLPGPPFHCPLCQKFSTLRRDGLKRHLLSHYKNLKFKCPHCPAKRKHQFRLREHMARKHSELYPQDPPKTENHGFTEEQFINPNDPKFPYRCPICWKPCFKRSLAIRHIDLHSNEKKHLCAECGKTFRMLVSLQIHISHWHPQGSEVGKTFPCFHPNCPKTFLTSTKLRLHLRKAHQKAGEDSEFVKSVRQFIGTKKRAVLNRKPLECGVCQRKFNTKELLNKHRWRHNPNLLKFVCSFAGCSKKFATKSHLTNHLSVHSDEKKFACNYNECGATFKFRSSIRSHKKRFHPTTTPTLEAKFSCSLCPQKFPYQLALTLHLNNEHFGRGHECDRCFQIFVDEEEFKVHKETAHLVAPEKDENYKRRTPKVKTPK